MQILFRLIILVTLSLLGGLAYAFSANLLIMANAIPTDEITNNFGYTMTQRAVFVWIVAVLLGIISIFIQQKWRYILLLCPLVAPSLFALLYTVSYN